MMTATGSPAPGRSTTVPAPRSGPSRATEAVAIREGEPSDLAFVLDSWRASYRGASGDVGHVSESRYRSAHGAMSARLAQRSRLLVACLESAPDVIVGWVLVEGGPVVHYVYVRGDARHGGIARGLLAEAGIGTKTAAVYTHRTAALHAWRRMHPECRWEYDPWLAFEPAAKESTA